MLYETYNHYVSSRDLQFGKRLGCSSKGVKGCKQKISENEAENIFFWLHFDESSDFKNCDLCDVLHPAMHLW